MIKRSVITERSFLAEELKAAGVKVEPAPKEPIIEATTEMLHKPNARVQKLVDELLDLNLLEVGMFFKAVQVRLGLPDEAIYLAGGGGGGGGGNAVAQQEEAAPAAAAPEPPKVKDVFELKLKVVDAKAKIKVIKEVRTITGLGLKEAKDLVEKAPCLVKENLSKEEGEKFMKLLVEAGAEAELV
eukprot:CAMPEP_0174820828 /NCGR_PEP_ID=MMETSP1107-20130205/4894_1 /TAXON_ID=36770 /ORGANISM="Paraphysomonas vestita, Strain GFlagA" /LENGTH=184 /DNA_ID=CAMNT_0016036891 /DNA_START=204 /DNA_END=758 /DNA_ORIENTATION=-